MNKAPAVIGEDDLPTAAELLPIQRWVKQSNDYMVKATEAIAKLRQKYPRLQRSRDEFNTWLQANFGYSIATYSKQTSILDYSGKLDEDTRQVYEELPWTTRYALTRAPADEVAHLIGEGVITKVTEAKDVREAIASVNGKTPKPKPEPVIIEAINTTQGKHVCECRHCGRTFPVTIDPMNLGELEKVGMVTAPGTAPTYTNR